MKIIKAYYEDLAKLIYKSRLPIWRQSHHLAFVAVMREPEKLSRRRVDDSG